MNISPMGSRSWGPIVHCSCKIATHERQTVVPKSCATSSTYKVMKFKLWSLFP